MSDSESRSEMSSPDSPLSRESDSGRDDRSDSGTDTGSYNSMERSRPRKDRPAKKQKKRRIDFRSRYIDYAAEEAAEDEEEERELQAELRTRGITEEQYHQEVMRRYREEAEIMRKRREESKTAAEIAEEIERKFMSGNYADRDEMIETDNIGMEALLPDATSPKLWMVKCDPQKTMHIVIALMNKYVALASEGKNLGVFSASSTARGIIHIEAYREGHVRDFCSGIMDLYSWQPGAIKQVPIVEMPNALKVVTNRHAYTRNQFVRFTGGAYKDDVAQVLDLIDNGSKILVRHVPRINIAMATATSEQKKKLRAEGKGGRAPPRLWDRNAVETALQQSGSPATVEVRNRWGYRLECLANNAFGIADRLQYREVKPNAITPNGPPPTTDEVARFRIRPGATDEDEGAVEEDEKQFSQILAQTFKQSIQKVTLNPGDDVLVVKGDLAGLTGSVLAVNPGGTFTLRPSAESEATLGLTGLFEIPVDDATKAFVPGTQVKILEGEFQGETGTVLMSRTPEGKVVSPFDHTVAILLNSGNRNVEVSALICSRTVDVVESSVASLEGIRIHDLVDVPGVSARMPTPAVVIGLGTREVRVLLTNGKEATYPVASVMKPNVASFRANTAADSKGQFVSIGDAVRIIGKEYTNRTGVVKHISKSFLFVFDFKKTTAAGMMAVRSRYVVLISNRQTSGEGKIPAVPVAPTRPKQQQADMIGKSVMITAGQFKGRMGVIRNVQDDTYGVELHQAMRRQVVVNKNQVQIVGGAEGRYNAEGQLVGAATKVITGDVVQGLGGQTPAYGMAGGQTPAYGMAGGQTPAYGMAGGQTPAYGMAGGQTPAYGAGGQTPAYGLGGQTPAYGMAGGQTPAYGLGGQTPAYGMAGGQTPAYGMGSQTPGYGNATPGGAVSARTFPLAERLRILAQEVGIISEAWLAKGVHVTAVEGPYKGKSGVVVGVPATLGASSSNIQVSWNAGQTVSVNLNHVRPVKITVKDQYARVVSGDLLGESGRVIDIDEDGVSVFVKDLVETFPVSSVIVTEPV